MTEESIGITEWNCGGCGRRHGWHCPYFGHPGKKMSDEERAAAITQMETDKKAGVWPFKKLQANAS